MTQRKQKFTYLFVIALQMFCAVTFIGSFIINNFPIVDVRFSWRVHEYIEIGTALGLVLGSFLGVSLQRQIMRRNDKVEERLRVASGEFQQLLEEHFIDWRLSKSEKDVAYFAIKGLSNAEMSVLRGTSEGTIKAQMNAIYKKAKVESRTQLIAGFIEELMQDTQKT